MNKPLIISILLTSLICIACRKEEARPSTIYITANVTDKETALPIDSVKVNLRKNDGFGSWIYLEKYYSDKDGIVKFSFQQEVNWVYDIKLLADSYESYRVSLDKNKENQNFNVQLIKKQQ